MDQAGSRHYPDKPGKVYLFGTCLIDLFCPDAGVNAVKLLEREGIEVHFPADQTCCAAGNRRTAAVSPNRRAPSPWRSCGSFRSPGR